jgi:hypothetical protein
MPALPDSDIDEMNNELINMNANYESEEYRWWIEFDKYENTKSNLFCSDDDNIYPCRAIDTMNKVVNIENKKYESDEYR